MRLAASNGRASDEQVHWRQIAGLKPTFVPILETSSNAFVDNVRVGDHTYGASGHMRAQSVQP